MNGSTVRATPADEQGGAVLRTGAGFLGDPRPDDQVERMYASDVEVQGYVANLTRTWAHSPEALAVLSYALRLATEMSGLDVRQRSLLVTACASAMGDPYCTLAFGSKLAASAGDVAAAGVVRGDDAALTPVERLLAAWARRMARDPNATTAEDVEEMRSAGFDDARIFGTTLFVALRLAFSTVNDTLGAAPDAELVDRAPQPLREAVTFGRRAAARQETGR